MSPKVMFHGAVLRAGGTRVLISEYCAAILGILVAASGTVYAQQGSMFGANSPTTGVGGISSSGSMTGSSSGPGAMTSSAFGSAFGGTGAGRGPAQLGGTGQIGAGYNNPAAGLGGQLGQVGGANIVGRNNMQGQIGNALAGQGQRGGQGGLNQQGRGGAQGARGAQGGRNARGGNNRGGAQNFNQQQGMGGTPQQQQRQVRPQLRVSFDYDKPVTAKTDQTLTTRFDAVTQRFAKNGRFQNISVEADGGIVTLRGQVGRDEDRRLAETIAKLEPGVRSVKNELTVGLPAASSGGPN